MDSTEDVLLREALLRIKEAGDHFDSLQDSLNLFSKARMKAVSIIANLKDSAPKRQEIISQIEEMSILFFQLGVKLTETQRTEGLESRLECIERKLSSVVVDPSQGRSFADVARSEGVRRVQAPTGKNYKPMPTKAVLITPLDPDGSIKTAEDTKKVLLTKVKPIDLGIKPDRILKRGKAGIRIETKEIDENQLNSEALKKAGLKAKIVGKFRPRVAVFGVPSDLADHEIKDEILKNLSEGLEDEQLEIKSKFGPRGRHYNHWVVEVNHLIRDELLAKGRIYIGWSSCIIKDHIRVIRCFKCQKFGHLQKECRGEETCGYCMGGHDTRNCPAKERPPRCLNCDKAGFRDASHEAKSSKCHVYLKKIEEIISNTDYGL